MMRCSIQPKVCPRCGCVPMIWMTPDGRWWAGCSNNGREWHEVIQVVDMTSKKRMIKKWNELTDVLWCDYGVRIKRHKERPIPEDAPYWITIGEFNQWYECSNCGYVLAPRQEICPKCLKRMRPHHDEL